MRLIDADALVRQLETQDYSCAPETLEDWTPRDLTIAEIADIKNAPTIEAEPVRHGMWVRKEDECTYWYECSECGEEPLRDGWTQRVFSRYCPNCGALMDKGDT